MSDLSDLRAGDVIEAPDGERRCVVSEIGDRRVVTELHGKKAGEFRDERVVLKAELFLEGWRKVGRA